MFALTQHLSFKKMSKIIFCIFFMATPLCAQTPITNNLFVDVVVENLQLSLYQQNILNTIRQQKSTIEIKIVRINSSFLTVTNSVDLNLFPGKSFTALKKKIDFRNDNDFTWYGSIDGQSINTILSVYRDAVAGFVSFNHENFNLQALGNGFQVIVKVDPEKYLPCGNSNGLEIHSNNSSPEDNRYNSQLHNTQEPILQNSIKKLNRTTVVPVVKVFVAYTTSAKNLAMAEGGIDAIIDNAIAAANQAYINSGNITIQLELAHKREVTNYSETSATTPVTLRYCNQVVNRSVMLSQFQNPTDGIIDDIHDYRGLYGGDIAVLFTTIAPDCGQAYEFAVATDGGGASEAFCVVNYNCAAAAGSWSFAHEIGHLQGARHQKGTKISEDNCDIPFSNGHGYILSVSGQQYRTIMAVEIGQRILHWSNPNINYQGIPTGNTTTSNVASVIQQTAQAVADLVQELSGTISVNTTLDGIISLSGNVSVANNATLTIASTAQLFVRNGFSLTINNGSILIVNAGAKLKFGTGASLIVNGKIVADSNNPNQRILFSGVPNTSGTWNGITINSGSSTNISTLRRCDIQYATDGIKIIYTGNSNNVTIDKCRISNNSANGIYVYGLSTATADPTISNNHIHHNSVRGIYLQNYARPNINNNRMEFHLEGMLAQASSTATVEFNYVSGNVFGMSFVSNSHAQVNRNTIKSNGSLPAVYITSSSNVTAYGSGNNKGRNYIVANSGDGIQSWDSSPIFGKDVVNEYGNNQIQDNGAYQASQPGSGQLRAEQCYWAGQQTDISGNVDNVPFLSAAPNPVGWGQSDTYDPSLIMMRHPSDSIAIESYHVPVLSKLTAATNNFDPKAWSAQFNAAMQAGLSKGDWADAAEVITQLWRELQDGRVPTVDYAALDSYAERTDMESSIRKYLALTLVEKSLAAQNVSLALKDLARYRQSNATYNAELLANTGIINLHFKNDLAAANSVLSQLNTLAAQNDVKAREQEKQLSTMIENYNRLFGAVPKSNPNVNSVQSDIEAENSLLAENFPNPFNPETKIRYQVPSPDAQEVALVIFNLFGQQVRTLVSGRQNSGNYAVIWDGRDHLGNTLASGTYFLRATIGAKTLTHKLMLLR